MRSIRTLKIGLGSGDIGSGTIHLSTTGITFAEYVAIGFTQMRSRWTTSSPGRQTISLTLIIFNQPMAYVTIEKEAIDGRQK